MIGKQVILKVEGMSCRHCVRAIQQGLEQLPGVQKARVDLDSQRLAVEYDESLVSMTNISELISDLGYEVQSIA